jgi:flagellar motility protein MotE (MotC chaperone)
VTTKTPVAATPAAATPTRALRRLRARLLPFAAAGLAGLLPWVGVDLMQRWQAEARTVPTAQTLAQAGDNGPVVLPSGVVAVPVSVAALAATERASPIGDDRPVDGHLLAEVARRKAELDHREHELQLRETQLDAASTLARQQITELTQLRQTVEGLVRHESTVAEEDMNLLVGLFSNMKPPQAAAVIGKLDPPKAARILQRLDTHMAGPILAAMETPAALAITEEVEQRRASFQH